MNIDSSEPSEVFETLVIVGTGLMGGSFALAAREAGLCTRIVGVDTNPDALSAARELGIIDEADSLGKALKVADCVVVATPPQAVSSTLKEASSTCDDGTLVMDLSSVKEPILESIDEFCPLNLHFISVHPMAGREVSGPESATKTLFQNAPVILVPSVSTRPEAIERADALWRKLGARLYQALPAKHDELVTGVSHLPQVLAYALASTLQDLYPDMNEVSQISGSGLKGMIRTARSDPNLWNQILTLNNQNTHAAIQVLIDHLQQYQTALDDNPPELGLKALMNRSHEAGVALSPDDQR